MNKSTGKTVLLWILGFICCLPIPVTILIAKSDKLSKKVKTILIGSLWAVIFLAGVIGGSDDSNSKKAGNDEIPKIEIGFSYLDIQRDNYEEVEAKFKEAGFDNITLTEIDNDSKLKSGDVESVIVNGEDNFHSFDKIPANSKIVINYYKLIDEKTTEAITENSEKTTEKKSAAKKSSVSEEKSDLKKEDNSIQNELITLNDIPVYSDSPYVEINNNIPFFTEEEKLNTTVFENYSNLDSLGRCGVAYANLCKELLPTEERGEIGDVRPSGWHTVKYNDLIEGNYLYNRCHLIAYRLAGENANRKNLITGTRYLNSIGMLTFENTVGDYIEYSDNHVLYRVTPIFEGDNLIASGVEMEAWSVEDGGKDICFNVYCYNVQPGISIDYATGDSEEDNSSNGYIDISNNDTTYDSNNETKEITTDNQNIESCDYVVNTNTKKFHKPTCSSVSDMAEHNKWYYSGTIDELKGKGYIPCKRCLKGY